MERLNLNGWTKTLFVMITVALIWPASALATGPRVTTALFSPDKSEIHAVDFPPFVSTEVIDGGVIAEIVSTALVDAKVDAVLTIHPLKQMVNYYLLQENAIAIMGRHLNFTEQQKRELIFVPVINLEESVFYYAPRYPKGLKLNMKQLKGITYGAHPDEDVSAMVKAGATVQSGATMALLKKLKRGEVDFIKAPMLNIEWLVKKFMSEESGNFVMGEGAGDEEMAYMLFNRKHADGAAAAEKFKTALAAMIKDGRYAAIIEKHLGGGHSKRFMRGLDQFK